MKGTTPSLLLDQLDEIALDLVLYAQGFQAAYELCAAFQATHHRSSFHQQVDGVLVALVAGSSYGSSGELPVSGRGIFGMFFLADSREPECAWRIPKSCGDGSLVEPSSDDAGRPLPAACRHRPTPADEPVGALEHP